MKTLHLLITTSLVWAGLNLAAQSAHAAKDDVAVIIGNKVYADQDIPDVTFAHNDAQAMRKFVEDVLEIRPENIIYMEDATQAKMQSAFGRQGNHRGKAFQYIKPDVSNLYVFYSGHGLPGQHDNKSYLLPVDAEIETADINGYPTDLLYNNLKKIDAKSVTVFLDACFSGNSHGGSLIKKASGAQILPAKKPSLKIEDNLTVLTAASKDQLASWDEENQHGLFTEYLLRALYGEADKNNDGKVVLNEVGTFLKQDMRYKARRTYNRDQIPTIEGNTDQIMVAAVDGIYPKRPETHFTEEELPEPPQANLDNLPLTPVEQNMFALKNANVRARPDVRSPRVTTIPKGEPIHVAAKVTDAPWYAVESGETIIGFIYADLLGEEKEIATEEENRSIRELKARLEKLEEQTRLSSKDILPDPPSDHMSWEDDDDDMTEKMPSQFPDTTFGQIDKKLRFMGAILARQSFIKNINEIKGQTSFKYNWIRVDAEMCTISASVSMRHDSRNRKSVNIHDRKIQSDFLGELVKRKRILRSKNIHGDVVQQTTLYQYGPFAFKTKKERRLFIKTAKDVMKICNMTNHQAAYPSYSEWEKEMRPPPQRRRPPPPPFGRPPPRR